VASRQQEKERRRQERIEREEAEKRAAGRRKRLQLVGGGVLAAAAVAAVIVAVVVGTGGSDSSAEQTASAPNASAKVPAQTTSDYLKAAKAAGCTLSNPAYEGAGHIDKTFTAKDYKTSPPTSGPHTPTWYQDGVYDPGNAPNLGDLFALRTEKVTKSELVIFLKTTIVSNPSLNSDELKFFQRFLPRAETPPDVSSVPPYFRAPDRQPPMNPDTPAAAR